METKKRLIIYLIIVIMTLLLLVIGASYAYFSVTSTNSFGSKTISASAPEVGSVILTSGSNLTMNITASQMMKKDIDISYYASSNGTVNLQTTPVIAKAKVSGDGIYTCDYTLEISKSATNDLYTAFQGWSGKTEGQIVLTVGNNVYDFNTANLFTNNKIVINGTLSGIASGSPGQITAQLKFVNKKSLDQSALKNKDITLTFSATSFNCSVTGEYAEPTKYYKNNSTSDWVTNSNGMLYYLKRIGNSSDIEVCGVFNGTESCFDQDSYDNMARYYNELTSLGATCNSNYETSGDLICSYGSVSCGVHRQARSIQCSYDIDFCEIYNSGNVICDSWDVWDD